MRKMLSRFMAGFICSVMMFTTFGSDLSAATKTLPLTDSDHHVHTACADEACLEEGLSESGLFSILGLESLMNSGLDGSDIKIAIFDTGIQSNQVNIAGAVSFVEDTTISNDHGTRMAETLAVIAPEADLYDVRILDDNGEGKYSDIARGIDWAIENDIQIIALSVEGFEESDILAEALEKADANNILVIAAAGNQGSNEASYPAAYPQVISVGAMNASGEIASYSNYGDQIDVFAPGVGIGDSCEPGTSYSVQYIAGVAALLWSADATLSGAEIRNLITGSVSDGRLDAAGAYTNLTLGDFSPNVSGKANITGSRLDGVVYAAACSHSYVLASTTSSTCTAQGYQTYRCYKCGVTQKRNYVSAKGHSYYNVTTSATCTNAATCTTKCNRCSYSNTIITSGALGHSYTVLLSTTPKTCTAQGYSTYRCSRCSATQVRDYVAADHNYYTVVVNPTCTSAGSSTLKCRACTYSNTYATIPALGHNYTVLVSTTPKTCTARGYSTYRCSRCAATQNRDYVAAGHDTYTVVVDPTCTSAGSSTLKCRACTYSNTYTPIPALGHNYTVFVSTTPKTCTKQGYTTYKCSRCSSTINKDYVEAAGHDTYTVVVNPTCTSAGSSTLKCRACTYSNTYTPIPALGHGYGNWVITREATPEVNGLKESTCSRCGVKSAIEIKPVIISSTQLDFPNITDYSESPYIMLDYATDWQFSISSGAEEWLHCEILGTAHFKIYADINYATNTREGSVYIKTASGYQVYNIHQAAAPEIPVEVYQIDLPCYFSDGSDPYEGTNIFSYDVLETKVSSGDEAWLETEIRYDEVIIKAKPNCSSVQREGTVGIKLQNVYYEYHVKQAAAKKGEIASENYSSQIENALSVNGRDDLLYGPGNSGILSFSKENAYCVVITHVQDGNLKFEYIVFTLEVSGPSKGSENISAKLKVLEQEGQIWLAPNMATPVISASIASNNNDIISQSMTSIRTKGSSGIKTAKTVAQIGSLISTPNGAWGTFFGLVGFLTDNLEEIETKNSFTLEGFSGSYFSDDNQQIRNLQVMRKVDVYSQSYLQDAEDEIYMFCLIKCPPESDKLPRGGEKMIYIYFDFDVVYPYVEPSGDTSYAILGSFTNKFICKTYIRDISGGMSS